MIKLKFIYNEQPVHTECFDFVYDEHPIQIVCNIDNLLHYIDAIDPLTLGVLDPFSLGTTYVF